MSNLVWKPLCGLLAALSVALGALEAFTWYDLRQTRQELETLADLRRTELAVATAREADHKRQVAALETRHKTDTDEREKRNAAKFENLQRVADGRAARIVGLQRDIGTYAGAASAPSTADGTPRDDSADRLRVLGSLLATGVGLVEDGRGIIERRDAEVAALLEQVKADRLACQAPL